MATGPAAGKVLMTADEALALAYPGCEVERGTVFLTREQLAEARRLSGEEIRSSIVHPYRATCPAGKGGPEGGGTAYFDVHRVRTLDETLMVALDASGAVKRIEVLSFMEPEDYLPREVFYQQYEGKTLGPDLQLKRDIRNVTGATLTARATTEATRRVLALHRVIGDG